MSSLLCFKNVSKRFGGTLAVDNVSLNVQAGSVLALLGENGAGKSTLIKLLAGVYPIDSGSIEFLDTPLTEEPARDEIAFIHQDLGLIDWMSAAENVAFGCGFARRAGLIDWKAVRRRAVEALALVDSGIDPDVPVSELGRTQKSLLAIARALATNAKLIVLDEPTASLPQSDVERLFGVIESLRARGVGMIYVSHRLDEIFRVADRVAVMRDGRLVGEKGIKETNPEDLVGMIVGRKPQPIRVPVMGSGNRVALELQDAMFGEVGPVSFRLRAGELLALAGLRGAGQDVVGRALFGLAPIDGGAVRLCGTPLNPGSPGEAMNQGIGFVAGDRTGESLAMPMSVRENLFLNPRATGRGFFRLKSARCEHREALALTTQFSVRPNDPASAVENLSGGNQQKVVMARWLQIATRLLILEEPTAGVDVGARADIYALVNQALERGLAVLLISTDFEEVSNIAHRALIFNRGQVIDEIPRESLSIQTLLQRASASECASA
ncbi:sugar ABC transporter ATP-binding protein [Paraburkholderia nemoris]|uniref:Ribose import ATP-binding protein RbsA n=1 Tax=Paraburkholderia nemoris TaxID=2793076 RepID=A0ABM8SY57_9BURK|nr:sugar ABC transporter ATP-binding protein [Paraburkholderia nemoris]CAE6713717.1 Ribose import ATP-binding protein RbsA [Paraburkholderia nemoris]CAE6839516.1 Ribose import ATP-binding protein RbsA [Paraburkholderia nemoris]